ncbi:hypothetical protein Bca4012_019057 [Brassica carinata]
MMMVIVQWCVCFLMGKWIRSRTMMNMASLQPQMQWNQSDDGQRSEPYLQIIFTVRSSSDQEMRCTVI